MQAAGETIASVDTARGEEGDDEDDEDDDNEDEEGDEDDDGERDAGACGDDDQVEAEDGDAAERSNGSAESEDSEETVEDLPSQTTSSRFTVSEPSATIGSAVDKVRALVCATRKGAQQKLKYIQLCKKKKMPNANKLKLDCPTRWSSTFAMLEAVLDKRPVLEVGMSHFTQSKKDKKITAGEWELLQMFLNIQRPFALATDAITSSKRQTVSEVMIIVQVCKLRPF